MRNIFLVIVFNVTLFLIGFLAAREANAEIRQDDFPVKVQCGTMEEMYTELTKKYNEKVIFRASSGNSVEGVQAQTYFLMNAETLTYSIVNVYEKKNTACLIDSGKINGVNKVPQDKNTITI